MSEASIQECDDQPQEARGYLVAVVFAIVVSGCCGRRASSHASANAASCEGDRDTGSAPVTVVHPKTEPSDENLVLPSTLQAFTESPIYARTNGYLAKWYKDIGSRVSKGELLADIETPEIDQELMQAKAARDQARRNGDREDPPPSGGRPCRRWTPWPSRKLTSGPVDMLQAQANLAAATANVRRLEQLESFKHVYAPFSGVITRRNIDIGALINSGNTGPISSSLILRDIDPIRVYVDVPELTLGGSSWRAAEYPAFGSRGQLFAGNVVRNAERSIR